jgi:hypothetical protein
MSKTIAEQVTALEASRAAKTAAMEECLSKSIEDGRSTTAEEQDSFDELQREVEAIDGDLKRLRALEKVMQSKAVAIQPQQVKTVEDGSAVRAPAPQIRVSPPKLPPGIGFAQLVKCLGTAERMRTDPVMIAARRYGSDSIVTATLKAAAMVGEVSDMAVKAAVPAGSVVDPPWAGNLVTGVAGEQGVFGDFLEFLRPQTILGKFGQGGIPALRRVPFRTGLMSQTTGGAGYWVGEGDAKPLTRIDFARTTLLPLKVANIAVITDELLRDSSPAADVLVRDSMVAALRERLDIDFIDPTVTATTGVRPASITNGVTAIQSAGMTASQIRQDVRSIMANFINADNAPTSGVWVMRSTTALALSMMTNALGETEDFARNITMNGGTFAGLPVIVSEHVPASGSPSGDYVFLINANDIWFADDGGFNIDTSREASLEMDDAPTSHMGVQEGSPGAPVGASLVSLWQTNSIAFRCERTVNWMRARASGVQVLWGVNWGE